MPGGPTRRAPCRVRSGISQPVPVRRAAAQVPALLPGLGSHRGADPDPGPGDLPLGRQAQHQHRLLVILSAPVNPPAHLRHPQLDTVMLEQRGHRRVLAAVERPLVLPDHDRVPPPVRVSELSDQRGGPRAVPPRQAAAVPGVEELRHDLTVPGHQHPGLLPLPRPRRHRILPVLRRHPPVKREPQPAATRHARPAPPGALRPQHQDIPARASTGSGLPVKRSGHHPCASPEQTGRKYHIAPASPTNTARAGQHAATTSKRRLGTTRAAATHLTPGR